MSQGEKKNGIMARSRVAGLPARLPCFGRQAGQLRIIVGMDLLDCDLLPFIISLVSNRNEGGRRASGGRESKYSSTVEKLDPFLAAARWMCTPDQTTMIAFHCTARWQSGLVWSNLVWSGARVPALREAGL